MNQGLSPWFGLYPPEVCLACARSVTTDTCTSSCSSNATGRVYIAGIFDNRPLPYGSGYGQYSKHHFALAVELLNNKTDGVWDDVLPDAAIEATQVNSGCAEELGAPAYWSIRKWGRPLHGVVGCRCSGASIAVARVAQVTIGT
jgi:hypothetical protein